MTEKRNLPGIVYALPIIAAFLIVYGIMFSQFHQIPGPLYGGDYYFHYGIAKHISNGNMPWTCPQVLGEWAFYPWLLHVLVVLVGWLTGDLLASFILYTPLLIVLLGGVFWFMLGDEVFGDKRFALLTCLGWLGTRSYVGYIPANFTPMVTVPLFLYALVKARKDPTKGRIAFGGLAFGLLIMSHASALPAAGFVLLAFFAYEGFLRHLWIGIDSGEMKIGSSFDSAAARKTLPVAAKAYLGIFVVGFLIGLIYWGPVLFVYHFRILNPWNEYTQPDYSIHGTELLVDFLSSHLFNHQALASGSWHLFIYSLLTLIGLLAALRRRDSAGYFTSLVFLAGVLGYMHFLITTPLLGTNYAPVRFNTFIVIPGGFLLMIYGVFFLSGLLKEGRRRDMAIALAALFLVASSFIRIDAQYKDSWTEVGRSPSDPSLAEMQEWIEASTDRNAVFISHDELAFSLNSLTGRKVVTERRTHYNPYVDHAERSADSAVILFGNDSGKALELLRKYNVSYLYWDVNFLQMAQNQPILVQPKYRDYLERYGVAYRDYEWYLDPAFDQKLYKKYPVLVVSPAKGDWQQPWSDGLQGHLVLLKEVSTRLQNSAGASFTGPGFRVYAINYSLA